jgi:DNA polymerase-3 subunit alpha
VLELLVKAGACDCLGGRRAQLMTVIERAVQSASNAFRDKQRGQKNLFGGDDEESDGPVAAAPTNLPDVPEWAKREKLAFEKEALGFFLTSHPLAEMSETIKQFSTYENKQLPDLEDGVEVILGGMVSAIKKAQTKKPSRNGHQKYVNFDFEDPTGVVRCIMWPEEYSRLGEKVEQEQIRFVRGKVDKRSREPNVVIDAIWTLEEVEKEFTRQVLIKFQKGLHDTRVLERVRDIIQKNPGKAEVVLVVITSNDDVRMRYISQKPIEQKISVNRELRRELVEALGEGHVKFVADLKKKPSGNQSVGR